MAAQLDLSQFITDVADQWVASISTINALRYFVDGENLPQGTYPALLLFNARVAAEPLIFQQRRYTLTLDGQYWEAHGMTEATYMGNLDTVLAGFHSKDPTALSVQSWDMEVLRINSPEKDREYRVSDLRFTGTLDVVL